MFCEWFRSVSHSLFSARGMCNSALLFSNHVALTAHAALIAHRLDGQDDAAVGLCNTHMCSE